MPAHQNLSHGMRALDRLKGGRNHGQAKILQFAAPDLDARRLLLHDSARPQGCAVLAMATAAAFVLTLTRVTAAQANTRITVNTISDTSASGTCTLRDAINTAQGFLVAGSSCNSAVDTAYLIVFQSGLTGTIALGSTLPTITGNLTITGPIGLPGITISGGGQVQVTQVASGATLKLNNLTISDGASDFQGGCVENDGT
jgi:CSLREA domain-containing protein